MAMTRATLPEMATETVMRTVTVTVTEMEMGSAKVTATVASGRRALRPGPPPAAQAVAEAPRA
jgi:hypothetical protein